MARGQIATLAIGPIVLSVGLWASEGGATEAVPLSSYRAVATDAGARASPVPKGWKTYAYAQATISVPRSWAVRHNGYRCTQHPNAPGTLFLLPQSGSDLCVRSTFDTNSVTISPLRAGTAYREPSCPPAKVNGLTIYVGPCGSSNTGGITLWSVPALGVQALGTGTASENVTGSGNGTVIGRILHTLRRRH
jgi:hypothetical protein